MQQTLNIHQKCIWSQRKFRTPQRSHAACHLEREAAVAGRKCLMRPTKLGKQIRLCSYAHSPQPARAHRGFAFPSHLIQRRQKCPRVSKRSLSWRASPRQHRRNPRYVTLHRTTSKRPQSLSPVLLPVSRPHHRCNLVGRWLCA